MFYPEIKLTEKDLVIIMTSITSHGSQYIKDSPYCQAFKKLLTRSVLEGASGLPPNTSEGNIEDFMTSDNILADIISTMHTIKNLEVEDTKEKIQVEKLKITALQKLLELKQEMLAVKDIEEFTDLVLETIEHKLEKDDIKAILDKLST